MAIYEVDDCYGIRTDPDGICPYEGFMPSDCPESCSVCKYLHGPTNADRIRAMTDEELAKFLYEEADYPKEEYWLKWLKQEASE